MATFGIATSLTSCATIFGGHVTDAQKRKPMPGEMKRQVRVGALIADILLFPLLSLPVDFATGAIYKPGPASVAEKPIAQPVAAGHTTRK